MKSKDELRKSFENGDIPKQEEFWDWQDSYWHKDEKLPADKIDYDFSKKADLVNGKVPASQLPSYVDDVLEFDTFKNLPSPGEKGKIYVVTDNNNQYRWSGTEYIQTNLGNLAGKLIPYTGATQNVNLNGKNLATSGVIAANAFNNGAHTLSVKSFSIVGSNPTSIGIKLTHPGTSNMMGSFTVTLFGYTGQTLSFRITMYKYNFNWYVPTITWIHGDSTKINNIEFYKEDDANLHIKVNAVTNFGAYNKISITDVLVNPGDPLQSPDTYTLSINPDNSAHTLVQTTSLAGIVRDNYLVPYTGANKNVNLGVNNITSNGLIVNGGATNSGIGIALYNGGSAGAANLLPVHGGIAFSQTVTFGTHGAVTGPFATYFTNSNADRGWIFKTGSTGTINNVASIAGNGVFTGSGFVKSGGTASQFLKADGSVDSNSYSTTNHAHNFADLTNKPTTASGYGITDIPRQATLGGNINSIRATDTRSTNPLPTTDLKSGAWFDFKQNSAINLAGLGESLYSAVMTIVPYFDNSGNNHTSFRLAQSNNNLFFQQYNNEWQSWNQIFHTGNFNPANYASVNHNHSDLMLQNVARPASADFNTYKSQGFYALGGALTNKPTGAGDYGNLLVTQSLSDRFHQVYFDQSNNQMFFRNGTGTSTTWGTWKKILTNSDITSTNISNWNTAFGWGNHANAGYATKTFVEQSIDGISAEITDPDYSISVKNKFVTVIITQNFSKEMINWEAFYPGQSVTVINTGSNIINLDLQGKAFDKISERETFEYYVNKDKRLIKKGSYKETAIII